MKRAISQRVTRSPDSCCILYVLWWSYFILCFVYFNHLFLIHIGNNLDSDIIVLCINSKLFPKQINITSKSHRPSSKFSWWCFQKSFFFFSNCSIFNMRKRQETESLMNMSHLSSLCLHLTLHGHSMWYIYGHVILEYSTFVLNVCMNSTLHNMSHLHIHACTFN